MKWIIGKYISKKKGPKAEKIGRGNPKKIEPNDADTVHASLIEAEKKKEGKEGKRIIFQ